MVTLDTLPPLGCSFVESGTLSDMLTRFMIDCFNRGDVDSRESSDGGFINCFELTPDCFEFAIDFFESLIESLWPSSLFVSTSASSGM